MRLRELGATPPHMALARAKELEGGRPARCDVGRHGEGEQKAPEAEEGDEPEPPDE